jgi:hypothetical protein
MQFELMLSVAFIGLFHLAVGILIGRHLRPVEERVHPGLRGGWHDPRSGADLTLQLNSLVRERLASKPDADLTDRLRKLFEEIAQIVEGSRTNALSDPTKRETSAESDTAGISTARWFPATPLDNGHQGEEQRKSRRFAYVRKQAIAPVTGEELPDASAFVEVLFRDLSTNGFSFYLDEEFPVERLVAKLGSPPDIVAVLARVVRQNEMWLDGRWMFHIGCTIERRLDGINDVSAQTSAASPDRSEALTVARPSWGKELF